MPSVSARRRTKKSSDIVLADLPRKPLSAHGLRTLVRSACMLASAGAAGAGHATERLTCHAPGDTLTIQGRVRVWPFAGPSNYESTAHGDVPEAYPVLLARQPVCVADAGSGGAVVHQRVRRLQVLDGKGAPNHRDLLARCHRSCRLTGRLVPAESGHHHTAYLLELD